MKSSSLLRQLSHGEVAFYNTSLSITTISKVLGDIPFEALQHCFEILLNKHPILQCCVTESDGIQYFTIRASKKQKVQLVEYSDQDDAHEYFQEIINSTLNPQNSLIEIVILKPSPSIKNNIHTYILTHVSHIVSDGMCNIEFHNELLELCNQVLTNTPISNNKHFKNQKIPLPIENRLPHRPDAATVEDIIKKYRDLITALDHQDLHINTPASTGHQIEVLTQTFTEDETLQILSWCKKRNLSFNNVLTAALLISAHSATHQHSFLVRNAVNLRTKVTPPLNPNEFITSASSILTSTTIQKYDDLETLSHKICRSIDQALIDVPFLENHIANKEINKYLDMPLAFHISNLGKLNINHKYELFSLESILIAPGTSCGKTLPIVISSFKNKLSITTHALKDLYPQKHVQKIVLGAINLILSPN